MRLWNAINDGLLVWSSISKIKKKIAGVSQTTPSEVIVGQPGESKEIAATFSSLDGVVINVNGGVIYYHPNSKKPSYILIQVLRVNHR